MIKRQMAIKASNDLSWGGVLLSFCFTSFNPIFGAPFSGTDGTSIIISVPFWRTEFRAAR